LTLSGCGYSIAQDSTCICDEVFPLEEASPKEVDHQFDSAAACASGSPNRARQARRKSEPGKTQSQA